MIDLGVSLYSYGGDFLVTMTNPNEASPKPLIIDIDGSKTPPGRQ